MCLRGYVARTVDENLRSYGINLMTSLGSKEKEKWALGLFLMDTKHIRRRTESSIIFF
jgi:hypothetical protein